MAKKGYNGFADFFSKWFFLGIILILISIIWDKSLGPQSETVLYFLQSVGVTFLSTIGISIFVGSIFNWIIGTQNFSEYVKEKIVNVLVSRDYIGDLEVSKKKSMLMSIMRPNKTISTIYSRINDYFKLYAKKSMELFKEQQFRSNLSLVGRAKYDGAGHVYIDYRFSYRAYVVDKEHENIRIGFSNDLSKVKKTQIALPDSGYNDFPANKIDKEQDSGYLGNDCATEVVLETPLPNDNYRKAKYLDVIREIEEFGENHWINFSYRSSKPTDGMLMTIDCEGDLVVKDAVPYGPSNVFDIVISNDKKRVNVSCNAWMDPGYGVNILIANEIQATSAAVEAKASQTRDANALASQEQEPT